jgi:hypothetical protein
MGVSLRERWKGVVAEYGSLPDGSVRLGKTALARGSEQEKR